MAPGPLCGGLVIPANLRHITGMVEWIVSPGLVAYPDAVAAMEARVAAISDGRMDEAVWLLEHPPLYTAGTSAQEADLTDPSRFPVFRTGRGGQYTYHGPGQRIVYVMLNVGRRGRDVRRFVCGLERWVIAALAELNLTATRRDGRVGVWIPRPDLAALPDGTPRDDKIAAVGVKLRRWVSFHGVSINVEPDLSHYAGIIPCGIAGHGITSLVDLGYPVTMGDLDAALRATFDTQFGAAPLDSGG